MGYRQQRECSVEASNSVMAVREIKSCIFMKSMCGEERRKLLLYKQHLHSYKLI
jgi:hypothetical protein